MERPYPAYKGHEPYIFVSYAHADDDIVYREIQWLHDQGLNVWYDEGITPGEEWTEELAQAIKGASHFLYFVTPDSIESRNCRNEVNYALEHEQPLVCVHLKETQLSGGLRLSIGLTQAILKHELGERNYQEKLLTALKPEARDAPFESSLPAADQAMAVRVRRWRRRTVVGAATAVALLLAAGGWWLATMAGGPAIERLAVLPVVNLTNDPDQEYLVQGVHTGLIDELAQAGVSVIARRSVMQYQNSDKPIRDIARELGIDALIEASLERTGDSLRIRVQLIDGRTEEPLWTRSFAGELRNIVRLERQVTRAIVDEIELALTPKAEARLAGARPVNPEAYEAYLKGQFHVQRFTPEDMQVAAEYFQQAVALDPDYALGYWGLSRLCGFRAQAGLITPEQASEQCLPPMLKALDLDPLLPEAHMGNANRLTWQQLDWERADAAFERAIELNPSYAEAHMFYSHFLGIVGRMEESAAHMQLALQLDPLNPFVHGLHAVQLMMSDDYEGAVKVAEEVMASNPGFGFGHGTLWQGYFLLGDYDKAIGSAGNFFRRTRGDPTAAEALEAVYDGTNYSEALIHAAEVLIEYSQTARVPPMDIGVLYQRAGAIEKAVDWFEISYRVRDPDAPYMGALSKIPELNAHPRYQQLLRDMKLDYWADKFESP